MRGRFKGSIGAMLLVLIAMTAAVAQVRPPAPIDDPILKPPMPRVVATATASPTPPPAPLTMPGLPSRHRPIGKPLPAAIGAHGGMFDSLLGPRFPLALLAPLPPQTPANTASKEGSRRRMSGTITSIMYSTNSGCASTLGYIFNTGCSIQFQLAFCNQNNGNANCGSGGTASITSITRTDFFQDYYIDANTGTAQTIGAAYQASALGASLPADCTTQASCTYGPYRTLTLNNSGTVVLATVDCGTTSATCASSTNWVAVVYITVGSANGLLTFSDNNRLSPATQFTIPTGANTNTVYIKLDSAQYSDYYVIYIENTSTTATCTGTIGQTDSGPVAGLCNPVAATGTRALSSGPLNMQWTFGSGTLWTALTTGTYSLVAYDQTQNKRVAQTQVALYSTAGAQVSSVPAAGNSSPAPAPAATAGTRFAFDNTTDQSDSGFTTSWTGLTNGHKYCVTFNDPNGRVYQDYTTPSEKFVCITEAGTTLSLGHGNINAESPVDYAPNTYTITLCDYNAPSGSSPCTVVASQSVQLLGYNALTEFTNAAGTTVTGTSLVVPKNGSTVGGLEFVNDGDTFYGDGNGDTLSALYYSTATGGSTGNGSTLNLSCGASCTQTVTDSNGQSWYVHEVQHGGGANAYTTLTICPVAWGTSCATNTGTQTLAMNGSIVIPNITYFPPPGSSSCTGGNCQAPTSILPSDGLTWSTIGSNVSGNLTYFTNSNGSTYAGTGTFTHVGVASGCAGSSCSAFSGTVTSPCTVTATGNAKKQQQGFYPNYQQALYSIAEPFSPTTGQGDVYCAKITNNSSTGTITGLAFQLPSGYASGGYATTWSVDANSPSTWTQDTTSGLCPAAASFCVKPNGANTGIAIGASEIIYFDVQNLPPLSFNFADVSEQVYNPVGYQLTADACCTQTVTVGSTAPTQSTIDALALGAYSLDSGYMTPLFNPTSEGTSTNNTVNISLKNTSTSQDINPDYVDAIVFEFASTGIVGVPSGLTSNWVYLGSNSPGIGGGSTIDYWFGLCNAQFSTGNGPQSSPTTANAKSLPAIGGAGCTAAQAQNALSPGSSFSFNTTMQTGASAGTIPATAYAHGANGNGWSKGHAFSLTVSAVSATGGFSSAGTYGSPAAVASNTTPQVGPDTNTTFGNSFVYTITNTSGAGHNLSSAQILIPYQDSSGANGADSSNFIWKITAAPTLSGSGYTNCGVTGFTNPTAGSTNGYITIGNSGGTCTITPNGYITVSFPMQAPYKANDQYYFPACVNGTFTVATCGGVAANETWVGDSYIQTILGASLIVTVDATTNTHGTALSPICASCTYTPATNKIDFGSGLAASSTTAGTDVALVDLWTNASSPIGWSVYVTQTATDATAAAYLQTDVDNLPASKSYQPVAGSTLDQTSYAAIPVTGTYSLGLLLANSSSGTTSTRNPFEFSNNYRIVIPAAGADTGPNVSTVTYTFISN